MENDNIVNNWTDPDALNKAGEISHSLFLIVILTIFVLWFCYWIELIDNLGW